ncbi:hypothetical protein QNI19_32095 [Cytophagaceae bacterium DM2B3-1]|uniref:Uncharacterized protein n=1 Tax=Xanthocytophaga flava TaxID=3048013 RepID=A0ABT7CV27_9BACT|nr:hypothetical protein [Xanthocytophaga flavus]MDJ1497625.1 hypothetical protein [Xanthocytophaga flavus]
MGIFAKNRFINNYLRGILGLCLWMGIEPTAQAQQPLQISLSKQTLTFDPNQKGNPPAFHIIRVVDARPLKTHIGIVQRGLVNTKAQAFLKGGVEKQLLDFFHRSLPQPSLPQSNASLPMIVRVHQLSIAEKTTFSSETATAAVVIDFICSKDDSLHLLYQASSLVTKGGLDVTASHDDNIARALGECVEKFINYASPYDWQSLLAQSLYLSEGELYTPMISEDKLPNMPIFQDTVLMRGIYHSLIEFQNNSPSGQQPFITQTQERNGRQWNDAQKVTPYHVLPDGSKKEVKKVWGFSDGESAYIYFQKDFFPLRKQAGSFIFDAYAPVDGASVGAAGVMGGAIGGAIAGAATANRRQTYQLDVLTGQITDWDENNYMARLQARHTSGGDNSGGVAKIILYYKGGKASTDQPVTILFRTNSDTLTFSLKVDSFIEIPWQDPLSDLNVCVQGTLNPCYQFVADLTKVNYLEYLPTAKGTDEVIIRQVNAQEAEFYLKKIRYAQERNLKRQARK